jgi:hypothetical protein
MIQFEITSSPDENVVAPICFHKNQIYIGRSNGDLLIKDNEIRNSHLMIEVIGPELLIHPQKDVEFYLINSKRASVIRKLKVGDIVGIGKTIIKIIAFQETKRVTKKEILNEKLNKLIEENSLRLPAIESLTKRMKQ